MTEQTPTEAVAYLASVEVAGKPLLPLLRRGCPCPFVVQYATGKNHNYDLGGCEWCWVQGRHCVECNNCHGLGWMPVEPHLETLLAAMEAAGFVTIARWGRWEFWKRGEVETEPFGLRDPWQAAVKAVKAYTVGGLRASPGELRGMSPDFTGEAEEPAIERGG